MQVSVGTSKVKVVCLLSIQEDRGFKRLESSVSEQYVSNFEDFVEEYLYRYKVSGEVENILKTKEVLKLSSLGVLEPSDTGWRVAFVSDAYTAEEAIDVMKKYELLTPYTLILLHTLPIGLPTMLAKGDECFAVAKGQHEPHMSAIYPRIIPVLEAMLGRDEGAFNKSLTELSRAILLGDKDFIQLYTAFCQGDIERVAPSRKEAYQELVLDLG